MILLANGCSFTWGGSLHFTDDPGYTINKSGPFTHVGNHYPIIEGSQRWVNTWPGHLGKLLNCNRIVNLGMGCGSNERIFRTTFDWIYSQPLEILNETVAVIQFTMPNRYEYYDLTDIQDEPRKNELKRWALVKPDVLIQPTSIKYTKDFDISQEVYKHSSRLNDSYKMILQMSAVNSLLSSFNIKHFFWAPLSYLQDVIDLNSKSLERFPMIGHDKKNGYKNAWSYDSISKTDNHPNLKGHKQIADFMYNSIKTP